jgi:hypothetical protein
MLFHYLVNNYIIDSHFIYKQIVRKIHLQQVRMKKHAILSNQ